MSVCMCGSACGQSELNGGQGPVEREAREENGGSSGKTRLF